MQPVTHRHLAVGGGIARCDQIHVATRGRTDLRDDGEHRTDTHRSRVPVAEPARLPVLLRRSGAVLAGRQLLRLEDHGHGPVVHRSSTTTSRRSVLDISSAPTANAGVEVLKDDYQVLMHLDVVRSALGDRSARRHVLVVAAQHHVLPRARSAAVGPAGAVPVEHPGIATARDEGLPGDLLRPVGRRRHRCGDHLGAAVPVDRRLDQLPDQTRRRDPAVRRAARPGPGRG